MAVSTSQITALFESFGLDPYTHFNGTYEAGRVDRITQEINSGQRTFTDIIDTFSKEAARLGTQPQLSLDQIIGLFESFGLDPYTHFDSTYEAGRPERILEEINSGQRTLSAFVTTLMGGSPLPTMKPPSAGDPDTPPDPTATPSPTATPVDYKTRVKALYPWLPDNLVAMFANEWSDTGDPTLALATVRASTEYSVAFPGIKRDDGSMRMTEMEWFSTKEAYATLFREFGMNDAIFADRFTELMEGDVSPMELAERLGGAYEMVANNIPEVADAYSAFYGTNGNAALFASFIDPDLGQAILDRRISVAQVAGEGLARGFDVDASFAGKLVSGGVDQNVARNFFVQAEGQLQTLDDLARRHRDPDDTFDLAEFADANVFGDAQQTRRIRRLLHAEASLFTDQTGSVATGREGAITGLSAR